MEHINPKCLLQQYFQKRKLPLPKYVSEVVKDNKIRWISRVKVAGYDVFSTTDHSKKKGAEEEVADLVLKKIYETDESFILGTNLSVKNLLQEYCQKNTLPFPEYITHKVGKECKWVSQVKIADGRIFISSATSDRKEAERDAAKKALEELKECISKEVICLNDKRIAILIDFENQPNSVQEFVTSTDTKNIDVYWFISTGHPLIEKTKDHEYMEDSRIKKIVIPSTRRDGVDIGIAFFLGGLMNDENYSNFIIVSNDHFSDAVADCVNKYNSFSPYQRSAYACRSMKDAITVLKNLERES